MSRIFFLTLQKFYPTKVEVNCHLQFANCSVAYLKKEGEHRGLVDKRYVFVAEGGAFIVYL